VRADVRHDAMILYYTPGTCALGAMALLRHSEIPFQLCHVPRDARMGPVFRTINPHGHVPTLLTDDDRVVWEASAVLNHIARKAGGNLLPKVGSAAEDELFQWYSYLSSEFHAAFYPVFKPQLFLRDTTAHDDLRRDSLKNVRRQLAYIDVHLEDRRHVMGDTFGVLDAYLFSMARWGASSRASRVISSACAPNRRSRSRSRSKRVKRCRSARTATRAPST
jgi:glutathione S-transferase